jgi:hypothetical protein
MEHIWKPHTTNPRFLVLQGSKDSVVRCRPMPDGRYLWQFRKVISYAPSLEAAKDYVEAGAEFFAVMHRNPY